MLLAGEENEKTELLRRFRDEVLLNTQEGRKYVKLFYRYSLQLTEIINKNPQIRVQAKNVLESIIPEIQSVLRGDGATTVESSDIIKAVLDSISMEAGQGLKKDIDIFRRNFVRRDSSTTIRSFILTPACPVSGGS